jgi:hypothetical protein
MTGDRFDVARWLRSNRARHQAALLAQLAQRCIRESGAPAAETEPLRRAAELLPLDVEVVIRLIESYGDDSRASQMHRSGVMLRLASALYHAAIIGNWNVGDPYLQDKLLPRLQTRKMRQARVDQSEELRSRIRKKTWAFELADSESCARRVRKALGYKETDKYPSHSTVRRAIRSVLDEQL